MEVRHRSVCISVCASVEEFCREFGGKIGSCMAVERLSTCCVLLSALQVSGHVVRGASK